MYADNMTDSMNEAISETMRRREIQIAYNKEHGIDPQPLRKKISDVTDMLAREQVDTQTLLEGGYRKEKGARDRGPLRRALPSRILVSARRPSSPTSSRSCLPR